MHRVERTHNTLAELPGAYRKGDDARQRAGVDFRPDMHGPGHILCRQVLRCGRLRS